MACKCRLPLWPMLAAMISSLSVAGCLLPPSTTITTPLARSPAVIYTGIVVRPLLDSTSAGPDPKIGQRIMAETVTRLMQSGTFDYWHVADTAILSHPTFFPFEREALVPLDSLLQLSENVVELAITLTEFDKGDAFTRYMFGYLSGGGAVAIRTRLIDRRYGHVVVAGDTRRTVRGGHATVHSTIRPLARALTLFVDGNIRRLARMSE